MRNSRINDMFSEGLNVFTKQTRQLKRHLRKQLIAYQQKKTGGTGMIIHRIRSNEEFIEHQAKNAELLDKHYLFLNNLVPEEEGEFLVPGYSYTAKKQVNFIVDFKHSGKSGQVNWRERVCCPETFFNNRMRATFHLFDIEMGAYPDSKLYLTEQVTPIYTYFAGLFPSIIGSEFLEDALPFGSTNENGVRNETLCSLSFPDDSFDILISLDVFEHIPDYEKAFQECARVLKMDGKMMWSVPFIPGSAKNVIRARVKNQEIVHVMPPEYHGNPLSNQGVLCFQYFGWEMLDQIRNAGFRNAYALCYHSIEFGYLGGEQFMFVATK